MLCEQHKPTTSGAWEKMQELQWFHPLRDLYMPEDSCAHDSDDSAIKFFSYWQQSGAAPKRKKDIYIVGIQYVNTLINIGPGIYLRLFICTP